MRAKKIRLGVVGAGRHGRDMGRAARESGRFELLVCCDMVPDLANQAKGMVGYREAVTSVSELLQRDIDAVIVATTHDALAPTAALAASAGKHVYVEKPMATSTAEGITLVQTAAASRVNLMVGYCSRYLPPRVEMKKLIASGAIGDMVGITSGKATGRYAKSALTDPKRGGGALMFVGSHQIDQLLWFAGGMPDRVAGRVTLVPENGTDDSSWFTLEFKGGLGIQAFCSQNSGAVIDYVDITGTKGRIRGDYPTNELWVQSQAVPEYAERTYIVKRAPLLPEDWPSQMANIYIEEITEFADSIQEHRRPAIPGEAGVDVLRVIEAIRASSDAGGVPVEP